MTTLFISDLHLDPREGHTVRLFTEFVEREALAASALYILGDLFEAWIGDDDDDPGLVPILDALARLRSAGVPCAVMHGNRDSVIPFPLGQELFNTLTVPKQFVVIEGGDHNDDVPRDAQAYWSAVDGFSAGLRPLRE